MAKELSFDPISGRFEFIEFGKHMIGKITHPGYMKLLDESSHYNGFDNDKLSVQIIPLMDKNAVTKVLNSKRHELLLDNLLEKIEAYCCEISKGLLMVHSEDGESIEWDASPLFTGPFLRTKVEKSLCSVYETDDLTHDAIIFYIAKMLIIERFGNASELPAPVPALLNVWRAGLLPVSFVEDGRAVYVDLTFNKPEIVPQILASKWVDKDTQQKVMKKTKREDKRLATAYKKNPSLIDLPARSRAYKDEWIELTTDRAFGIIYLSGLMNDFEEDGLSAFSVITEALKDIRIVGDNLEFVFIEKGMDAEDKVILRCAAPCDMAVSRMPKDYCDLITRHNGLTIDFCGSETFFYAYSEKGMAKGMDEDVGDWHQQEERPTTDPFSICDLMLAVEEVECAWIYHPTELNSHGESCLCRFDSGGAIEKTEYSIKDVLSRYLFSLLTL